MPDNTQPHHYSLVRVQSETNVLSIESQLGVKAVRLCKSLYKKANNPRNKPGDDGRVIVIQRWTKKSEIDPEKKKKFDMKIKVRKERGMFLCHLPHELMKFWKFGTNLRNISLFDKLLIHANLNLPTFSK